MLHRLPLLLATITGISQAQDTGLRVAWTSQLKAPSFGSASVADIDGDGRLEIAFGTYFGDDSVRVLNGENGTEYWSYDCGNACLDASTRFVDLDGDGDLELVVPVSNKGWVLAFDAKSGDQLWRYETRPIECTDSPPAILDIDGDGALEVVYGTFLGNLHAVDAKTGKAERTLHVVPHFVQTGPSVLDLDGDGVLDFACATFKGDNTAYAVSGKTGERLWKFPMPGKHIGVYHGFSTGQLVGDAKPELTISAYDGGVYCLDGKTGKAIWSVRPGDRYFMAPTAIADVDGDGTSEVIAASENVTVISAEGKVVWSKPCVNRGGRDAVTRGASVADLDGDGKPDIATLSGAGRFMAFRGSDGKVLHDFDAAKLTKRPVRSSSHGVTIADLTGDGKLDVFFVVGATRPAKHGLAVCLTGFAGTGRGWYSLRHDPKNTGNHATPLPATLRKHIVGLRPKGQPVMRPTRTPKAPKLRRAVVAQQAPLDGIRQLAEERKIPWDVVSAALEANVLPVPRAALKRFSRFKHQGFRAALLLCEAGRTHIGTIRLLRATYRKGDEKLLLELAEKPPLPNFGSWTVLQALGLADTKAVREWLLTRLATERDSGLYMSLARALATLREKRALEPVARQILKFESAWSGVERHLLYCLPKVGADESVPWLEKYVHDARGRRPETALSMMQSLDAKRAKRLAAQLLDSQRRLSASQRSALRRLAGR